MAQAPTITYTDVKHKIDNGLSAGVVQVKDEVITPIFNGGAGNNTVYKVSYVAPYNQITGKYTPNKALQRFEIRVNPAEEADYGPGIGALAHLDQNIDASSLNNFSITVSQNTFYGASNNLYRVCLMAQCKADLSWDFTQLFMVVGPRILYKPVNSTGYDVHGTGFESLNSSYQAVEYLQSSGTQYINMGIQGNQATRVVIAAQAVGEPQFGHRLFGARTTSGNTGFFVSTNTVSNKNYIYADYGNQAISTTVLLDNLKHIYDFNRTKLYLDSQLLHTFNNASFTTTSSMLLFGGMSEGNIGSKPWKIFYCSVFINDVLVRDFIPCYRKVDGVIGMYDLVNNQFYTNNGTGVFVAGPKV